MSLLLDPIIASKYPNLSQVSQQELSDLIKDVITHGISRIQQASEFPHVREELELVQTILKPDNTNALTEKFAEADLRLLRTAFLAAPELYAEWLKFIIEFVTIEWGYCFSAEDKQLLDLFFVCSSPSLSLMTLCQSIGAEVRSPPTHPQRDSSEQVMLLEVSRWLVPFTQNQTAQLLLEVTTDVTCARHWPLLLALISSLGDRLVNRLARKTDPRFLAPQYFVRLSEQIIDAMKCSQYRGTDSEVAVSADWTQQSVVNTWSQLFGKLSTLGHADTLISRLVEWQMSPECQSVIWRHRLAQIMEHVPDSQAENLLAALITHLSHYEYVTARETLKQVLALSGHKAAVRYQLTNKLLAQRALEPFAHLLLVDYLYDTLPRDVFVQTLLELATVWSRQHVTESHLVTLTRALGRGLARLGADTLNEMRLLTTIFEGVSTHLATPPSVTREAAESIAALTAQLTAPDITPPFENKPPPALGIGADWLTVTRVVPAAPHAMVNMPRADAILEARETNPPKPAKKSRAPREIDPDQLYLHDGADSDDSLPEFTEAEDTADLSDVKVPVYLRDCLNNLMSDEPDLMEVTLHNLAALIRRVPDDLHELSVPIANALIHLTDQYRLRDFDRCLTDSLTALIAGSTVKVVTFITAQFYASDYSLQQRMLMLDVLTRGARELSALPKKDAPLAEPRGMPLTRTSHAVVTRVTARPAPPQTAVNRFAPHAGLFIYPLLQHYDRKSALLDLYHQDGIVLGQLLYSLGVFVECLNGNAAAPVLLQVAQTLLEVVWTVRHHPALTVRRALLYLCVSLCSSLPLAVLAADELRNEWSELLAWGVSVVKDEADEDCRVLATALVTKLVPLIDQNALPFDAQL